MSLTTSAAYITAVQKRLVHHFGVTPAAASRMIDKHQRFVAAWQRAKVPSDRAARALHDVAFQQNPISPTSQGLLTILAMVAASTGVYFTLQSIQSVTPALQPTVQPTPIPNFTPPANQTTVI